MALSACASPDAIDCASEVEPTYNCQVGAILESKCATCHRPGGPGPFALQTYEDAFATKELIRYAVATGYMPPWPPARGCTTYVNSRALSSEQIDTLLEWVDLGAPEGPPATARSADLGLPEEFHADATIELPAPYALRQTPDDIRCFLMPWSHGAKTITGFQVRAESDVHHLHLLRIQEADVPAFMAVDAAEPGQGFPCASAPSNVQIPVLVGAYDPGAAGTAYPAGTGIPFGRSDGAMIEVHYHQESAATSGSRFFVDMQLGDSATFPTVSLAWTDPDWALAHTMPIPAGAPAVTHLYDGDPGPDLVGSSHGTLRRERVTTLYAVALHMHMRGKSGRVDILHPDGSRECLLDIPTWMFHWQGFYTFERPKQLAPGDRLSVSCSWNNTPAAQPVMAGIRLPAVDLNWGLGTLDEMCVASLYAAQVMP